MALSGQNIWDRAVELADMTGSSFPTSDPALRLHMVNNSLARIHYKLAQADPDWFHSEQNISIVAGTESYTPSPNNVYRIKQLYYVSGSKRYLVPRFQHGAMDGWENAPLEAGTIKVNYIPEFAPLTSISSQIDAAEATTPGTYPPGWESVASMYIAIQLLAREESDTTTMTGLLADAEQQLMLHAEPAHDLSAVDSVIDVDRRFTMHPWARVLDAVPSYHYRMQGRKIYVVQPSAVWR